MRAFSYQRAATIEDALAAIANPQTKLLAGGTNLLDLIKCEVEHPTRLIDIARLPCAAIEETDDGGMRIGAAAKNSDVADHALIRSRYPLLAHALLAGASPQLRNMASVAGNLMQRTRCYYYFDPAFAECNKREPGSGCAARGGLNRMHAIFGASDHCVATHPSDMAVALVALDACVEARSAGGGRSIRCEEFHRLPGSTPERDTNLESDEIITSVYLPPSRFARHSCYLKIRDRASFAFALVSVAAALDLSDGIVRDVRIVLGGVAHKPWRARDAESELIGGRIGVAAMEAAAQAAVRHAQPLRQNAFKVGMTQRAVARALRVAAQPT